LVADSKFETVLIVACAKGGVIGINNELPWRLPEDLAHFKRLTTGHCIIMGRKTYESIGRPLPNRRSIVVTRDKRNSALRNAKGVELAASLQGALELGQTISLDIPSSPVFIIGGAQLYEQAIHFADRIELTEIDLEIAGDAFFPKISAENWHIPDVDSKAETLVSSSGLRYRFLTYRRKSAAQP
jgi:dihydrofolate reductase